MPFNSILLQKYILEYFKGSIWSSSFSNNSQIFIIELRSTKLGQVLLFTWRKILKS